MLDTEISPELIPSEDDKPTSDTESKVGPYELQDFFLFYILRFGYLPSKVAFMAEHAWGEKYSRAEIKHWLERLPGPLLPHQPVQAHGHPELAQGRLGRLALPAR